MLEVPSPPSNLVYADRPSFNELEESRLELCCDALDARKGEGNDVSDVSNSGWVRTMTRVGGSCRAWDSGFAGGVLRVQKYEAVDALKIPSRGN